MPAKAFSGPVVEFFLYLVNLFVGDVAEVGSFGEILADEAVGVFIELRCAKILDQKQTNNQN